MKAVWRLALWGIVAAAIWMISLPQFEGFFISSEKPRECIVMKPGYPEFVFIPGGDVSLSVLSYDGNLSGYWKVWGRVVEMEFTCMRLMGYEGRNPIWRKETRTYKVLEVRRMERVRHPAPQ